MTPPDDAALQERLQELFVEELDEQLQRLVAGVESLAGEPTGTSAETLAELFRCAHSLKGAAFAAGATAVGSVCHDLEDMLVKLRDDDADLGARAVARLTELVDTVAQRGQSLRAGTEPATETAKGASTAPDTVTGPASRNSGPQASVSPGNPAQRIAAHKVDLLMDQAGDLITTTYGTDGVVEALRRAERRLVGEALEQRRHRDVLLATLPDQETRARVAAALEDVDARTRGAAHDLHEALTRVTAHQQSLRGRARGLVEAARRARMVPFENATSGLHRMVRELAADLGKQVELRVAPSEVEVDKDLVQVLRDVLGHLVRNAVDHGIEPPPDRARAGKPTRGTVHVQASLHSDGVRVVVSDDGRGLDEVGLQRAASARGTTRGEQSPAELAFEPGLSTASRISAVSGRGVGLDAVRSAVERRGGTVSVRSQTGQGSTWTVVAPLNLSSMRTLLVRAGDELLALPAAWVRRLVPLPTTVDRVDGRTVVQVGEQALPLAHLTAILGWESNPSGPGRIGVVLGDDTAAAVVCIDEAVAEREIVLRGSPQRLEEVRRVLGTAQLEDGSVVLVLNAAQCIRLATLASAAEESAAAKTEASRADRRVLLAEDSLTTRELERSLLESAGFSVVVAHDGQQAWNMLQTTDVDAVVSDVNMPRMDGIELCRAIRGSTRLANLPVVLVTSLHTDADRRAGLDAGADAYLTKVGFNRDDLVEALERFL